MKEFVTLKILFYLDANLLFDKKSSFKIMSELDFIDLDPGATGDDY